MKLFTRRRMLMIPNARHDRLPDEFQEVEWLRGTGTQYCETAFHAYYDGETFISMRGDLIALGYGSDLGINNISEDFKNYGIDVQSYSGGVYCTIGLYPNNYHVSNNIAGTNINIHYEINQYNCVINETTYEEDWPQFNMTNNIVIGKRPLYDNSIHNDKVLIKTIRLYENNTLLSEIIPCFRKSDGVAGFYQTNVPAGYDNFITNLGTGNWLIGPNV